MLAQTADIVSGLTREGTPPGQIAILAPYLPSAMGFAIQQTLSAAGLQSRLLRPSIPIIENPFAQQLISLAHLAHPGWQPSLDPALVTNALSASIAGLDLVRAQLIRLKLCLKGGADFALLPFAAASEELRERIPAEIADRHETLRLWLLQAPPEEPLDLYFSRLFGEVLSQPGLASIRISAPRVRPLF